MTTIPAKAVHTAYTKAAYKTLRRYLDAKHNHGLKGMMRPPDYSEKEAAARLASAEAELAQARTDPLTREYLDAMHAYHDASMKSGDPSNDLMPKYAQEALHKAAVDAVEAVRAPFAALRAAHPD
jgi:hypothetical protein